MKEYKYGLPTRNYYYTLTDRGLRLQYRNFGSLVDEFTEYDKLGCFATHYRSHSLAALFLTLIPATFGVLAITHIAPDRGDLLTNVIFWTVFVAILGLFYLHTRRSGVRLESSFGSIVVEGKGQKLEDFLDAIQKRKIEVISEKIRKRAKVAEGIELEYYLTSLQREGVITEDDYIHLREVLNETRSDLNQYEGDSFEH